ncbi:MAG: hypothetical protein ACRC62_39785 [Microcoleus sp.]
MASLHELDLALQLYSDRTPVDENLRELIIQVCSHPRGSWDRRKSMNRLLMEVHRLPQLSKSSHPQYWEAFGITWEWLDKNLHNFHPTRSPLQDSFVAWINAFLRYRIKDLYTQRDSHIIYTGDTEYEKLSGCFSGFNSAIEQLETEEKKCWVRAIEQYIDRDPEEKLRRCHPRNRPDCNCQIIAQKLFLQPVPEKMTALAKQLNISAQTLDSFWRRKGWLQVQAIAREVVLKNSEQAILDSRFE